MNSPLIISKSQVADSSITMVRSIREVVQLDAGGSGMRRISKASWNLDFCDKGEGLHPSVPLCKQWF